MKSVAFILGAACAGAHMAETWKSADLREVYQHSPKLATMMKRAIIEPEVLAAEMASSEIAQVVPEGMIIPGEMQNPAADALPIAITHGMGDSCFNPGMKQITQAAGAHKGVYSVCVPGCHNQICDTISGFLTTMDKNVDNFAAAVKADPKLAGGFDAIGLSQGNSVIRGYIQRYNDPPVRNYLSVHGTVMGVSGFPNCNPAGKILPGICDTISEALGTVAYTKLIQNSLFQSNYFRDPERYNDTMYLENSQIAQWNNEHVTNATLTTNFESVNTYAMVKAMKDTMVFPNACEWWGEFQPKQFKEVWTIKETPLYTNNNFGLKTVDEANKIHYESTPGEHLQFTVAELTGWMDKYFN